MAETHGFIRVPPDSTGKRIAHSVMIELSLNTVTTFPTVGESVSFATSTHTGYFSEVEVTGASTCNVHLSLKDPIPDGAYVTVGEDILQNGTVIGKAATAGNLFYYGQSVIAGGENNINTMNVSNKGAASVTFTEGSPLFDAYGRQQTSNPFTIAEYVNRFDDLPSKFSNTITGGATATYNATQKSVVLGCTTVSGDKVVRRSNVWHKNQTGISQLIEMSVLVGDIGKTNVSRKWGYYDDNSGIRFELVGTQLRAVWRSSTSGTTQEIIVPQSQWNIDRLDGSKGSFNLSGIALDLTKINNFWFDVMCSAGSARCGVIIDNVRITCHVFPIGNTYATEHLAVGTLPITWEQENTGAAASASEFRVYGSIVKSEGELSSPYTTFASDNGSNVTVSSTTTYTPIFSGRAKQLFKSLTNRKYALPCEVGVISTSAPIIIELVKNATLTGATWAGDMGTDSCMEADMTATQATGGVILCSYIVKDVKDIDVSKIFNNDAEMITRKAVAADTPDIYTFRAKLVSTGTTDVRIAVNWKEL